MQHGTSIEIPEFEVSRSHAPDLLFAITAYWLLVALPHSFGSLAHPMTFDAPHFDLPHLDRPHEIVPRADDRAIANLLAATP